MGVKGGARFAVSMDELFPGGCNLMPESITEAQDYDEKTGRRSPAKDKVTGQRVYQVRVVDMDPELAGRSREVTVKVISDRQPSAPTGVPFEQVEFEGLTVTPYVANTGRLAYSIRATKLVKPKTLAEAKPAAKPGS